MYEHQSFGFLKFLGCAGFNFKKNFLVLFVVGSKAYIRKKARFGKMEFVVIKKILPQNNNQFQPDVLYVDTFNRIWSEDELLTQENALDAANLYWQNIYQEGRILFEQNKCLPIPPEFCS
jgi:hypothetical protein